MHTVFRPFLPRAAAHTLAALALAAALHPHAAHADAMPLEAVGGGIAPRTNTQVRLVDETVEAEVGESAVQVTADFLLRNEGPAATLSVGFPMGTEQPPQRFRAYRASGTSGWKGVPFEVRPSWFVWRMAFAAGEETRLRVTYVQTLAFAPHTRSLFRYILRTGAAWKGPIGHAAIRIRFAPGDPAEILWAVPAGSRFDGTTLAWDLANFEPDRDVAVRWHQRRLLYLHTDQALPGCLESAIPAAMDARQTMLPPTVTLATRGDRAELRSGATRVTLRRDDRRAVVNDKPWEMPATPVLQGSASSTVPLALLRRLGWMHAIWIPESHALVASTCAVNWDRWTPPPLAAAEASRVRWEVALGTAGYAVAPALSLDPETARWHRTPRLETIDEYRAQIGRLQRDAGQPDSLLRLAELRFYAGDLLGARDAFARCARRRDAGPLAPIARFWEAQCLAHQRDYRGAVALMEGVAAAAEPALANEARVQAGRWLLEQEDLYALPAGTDRFARAHALLAPVWKGSREPRAAVRAGPLLASLEGRRGNHSESERLLREVVRRSPKDPALPEALAVRVVGKAWGTPPPAGFVEVELLAKHFPGRAETRLALMAAHVREPPRRAGTPVPSGRPREWVRRVLAATPTGDPATLRFGIWARKWLGEKVTHADEVTLLATEARLAGDGFGAWGEYEAALDRAWKEHDIPRLRRLLAQARRQLPSAGLSLCRWEKDLAVVEGRLDDARALLQRAGKDAWYYNPEDLASADGQHAETVELLLRQGKAAEAAQWAGELLAAARQRLPRYRADGYRVWPSVYRAAGRALARTRPKDPKAPILVAFGDVPPDAGPGFNLSPVLARLEALAARYPREPLAWAALSSAHWVQLESQTPRYRGMRQAGRVPAPWERVGLAKYERSGRRLVGCFEKALALDPASPEVLPLLLAGMGPWGWMRGDAAAYRKGIGLVEGYLRRHPEDAAAWQALVPAWADGKAVGDVPRLRPYREGLMRAIRGAMERGRPALAPLADDFAVLLEQYRVLKRKPPRELARASARVRPPSAAPADERPEAVVARLQAHVLYVREAAPSDCLLLGQAYARLGRLHDAARAYRRGLRERAGYEDPSQPALREALARLPPDALGGPNHE